MKIRLRRDPANASVPPIGTRAERRRVVPQYLLPKRRLTAFAGRVASQEGGRTVLPTIRWFVRKYGVNMEEAQEPDLARYASFNDFFTRALKPGARPLAHAELVCPVDGSISQFGAIDRDQIVQAKGHRYSTTALVGGDEVLARHFENGHFATLYLSPRDYHRIHMPCAGRLVRMVYVPGDLFSVNPTTARGVPGLFSRNERLVCVFEKVSGESSAERFAMVLVGATIVGSMATVWHGRIDTQRDGARRGAHNPQIREWSYAETSIVLAQGEEMGRFLLGSTVVLLFPRGPLDFPASWAPGASVRVGEAMTNR